MLKGNFLRSTTRMVEALTVLFALQLSSQGLVPFVEGTGEPYGISRDVVEGAARAGGALNPPRSGGQDSDVRPMPALSQVTATPAPSNSISNGRNGSSGSSNNGGAARVLDLVPCSGDGGGMIRFNRLPGKRHRYNAVPSNSDVISLKTSPLSVMYTCLDHCLKDKKTSTQTMGCGSAEFVAGRKETSYSKVTVYSETKCILFDPNVQPNFQDDPDYSQFEELCILPPRKNRVEQKSSTTTECPERMYVLETYEHHSFVPKNAATYPASSRKECQTICLNQQQLTGPTNANWVCRSGTWINSHNLCFLSSYTRRTYPHLYKSNFTADYFENTCLSPERRCPQSKMIYIMESNKRLADPYVMETYVNTTFEDCAQKCENMKSLLCRSFSYSKPTLTCSLSNEDSYSRSMVPASNNSVYYELKCIDEDDVQNNMFPGEGDSSNPDTQPLNQRRAVKTAFQLYRNRKLDLDLRYSSNSDVERRGITLAKCLDECLETTKFSCQSVMYSDLEQKCMISQYDTSNGNLVYDRNFDFYKNLMSFGGSAYQGPSSSGNYGRDFDLASTGVRLRQQYIMDTVQARDLDHCMDYCENEIQFRCLSFNFRYTTNTFTDNCELSNVDLGTVRLSNPTDFANDPSYDYYERNNAGFGSSGGSNFGSSGGSNFGSSWNTWGSYPGGSSSWTSWGGFNNIYTGAGREEVSQSCKGDGSMEFQLRTDGPFFGRVYTYGHYNDCYEKGTGSTTTYLTIFSNSRNCGTTKYRDTTTNIVVVQFSDNIVTMRDKRYNLTCTVLGPRESTVTSGYIGSGSGAPVPIEYLPEENRLQSRVKLEILYHGRPTSTIAVGDPLSFRLVPLGGSSLARDIFATNVIAKDPYSGREVQLIDGEGCPIDTTVFSSLDRGRSGDGLETKFSAFKIPDADALVFQATVKPCRSSCTPARCSIDNGRNTIPSLGRRRRRRSETDDILLPEDVFDKPNKPSFLNKEETNNQDVVGEEEDETEEVHGMYKVYMTRDEIPLPEALPSTVPQLTDLCISPTDYYSLLTSLIVITACLVVAIIGSGYFFRKHQKVTKKNSSADSSNPNYSQPQSRNANHNRMNFPGPHPRTVPQPARQVYFPSCEGSQGPVDCEGGLVGPLSKSSKATKTYKDPSEPIYTDPNLFEN